jgi:hypothetical protein
MNENNPKTPTKRPVAPPVYRPQTKQAAVQAKTVDRGTKKSTPAAPPVYRPQPEPRVLQKKSRPGAAILPNEPKAPRNSVSKAVRTPLASPTKARMPAVQRKMAPSPPSRVIQRAIPTCPTHPDVEVYDGYCQSCEIEKSRIKQKPDQQPKKAETIVTLAEWSRDNKKAATAMMLGLRNSTITHRGNKVPRDVSNPGPIDLINHENSRAPVWFTTGGASIGSDIEKYSYHHVLKLKCNVSDLINANLGQTLNHSEGVSGEGTWSGYVVKSNEGGCFAVSTDKLQEFYRTYVTSHQIITK